MDYLSHFHKLGLYGTQDFIAVNNHTMSHSGQKHHVV